MFMAIQRFRVPHLRQMFDAVHAEMVQRLLTEYDRRQREQGDGRCGFVVFPLFPERVRRIDPRHMSAGKNWKRSSDLFRKTQVGSAGKAFLV